MPATITSVAPEFGYYLPYLIADKRPLAIPALLGDLHGTPLANLFKICADHPGKPAQGRCPRFFFFIRSIAYVILWPDVPKNKVHIRSRCKIFCTDRRLDPVKAVPMK